ncbi:MAG: lysoplasmalogenase [Clostridia bacterium]|nr:lysoplasmalogenase [Clostridia bacterium]
MIYAGLAAFFLMWAFYFSYQRVKQTPGHSKALACGLKCAATALAVFVALLGCLQNGIAAHWVLLAGLIACTVADGVLCYRFMAGGAVFALGHILYMVAFCLMRLPDWRSVLLLLALMGLATAAFQRFKTRIGRRAPFFYAYATVLSVMVALSAAQRPLFFTGALLFAFSDGLLGYLLVDRGHTRLDYLCLGAYYLGQFVLALGMLV